MVVLAEPGGALGVALRPHCARAGLPIEIRADHALGAAERSRAVAHHQLEPRCGQDAERRHPRTACDFLADPAPALLSWSRGIEQTADEVIRQRRMERAALGRR